MLMLMMTACDKAIVLMLIAGKRLNVRNLDADANPE
jgi:hypothetical protein